MATIIRTRLRALVPVAVAVGMFAALSTTAPVQASVPYSTIFTIAKGQIGTLEGTAAADKYFSQPGLGNYKTATTPWCAAFVTWVSWMAGASTEKSASVNAWVSAAGSHANGLSHSSAPRAGDLVAFKWDSDSTWDHLAIVTSVGSGYYWTIEGNTSNPNGGADGVFAKRRLNSEGYAQYYIKLAA
jgi:hypothetical protein